jgi:hypothetical protein
MLITAGRVNSGVMRALWAQATTSKGPQVGCCKFKPVPI